MKTLPYFQINAFTEIPFTGNPGGVCPLNEWLPASVMQMIALENKLSETVFFVPCDNQRYHLRWFTPDHEMDLCGHGTLVAAYVIFTYLNHPDNIIYFDTLSGELIAKRYDDLIQLDFPIRRPKQCAPISELKDILNIPITDTLCYKDKIVIVTDDAKAVQTLVVDHAQLAKLPNDCFIVTAADKQFDFVSRYLHPKETIKEDPVTGSAHCILAPYWANVLDKSTLHAYQASARGGEMHCEIQGERVLLRGKATPYLQGEIYIPND